MNRECACSRRPRGGPGPVRGGVRRSTLFFFKFIFMYYGLTLHPYALRLMATSTLLQTLLALSTTLTLKDGSKGGLTG
jgi:hypothetical protein